LAGAGESNEYHDELSAVGDERDAVRRELGGLCRTSVRHLT
jgi:hypothetical protein